MQLVVEQSSTGKLWNPTKKDTPHPRTKKKPHWNGRRGTIMIKSNPISNWVGDSNLKTIIPKKFSHCCESYRPHIRLPSLGIWSRNWESPGNLTLRARRVWLQSFHRTGGHRDPWRTQTKSCAHQDPGERSSDPHRRLSQTHLWVLEGLLQRLELGVACPGRCVSALSPLGAHQ